MRIRTTEKEKTNEKNLKKNEKRKTTERKESQRKKEEKQKKLKETSQITKKKQTIGLNFASIKEKKKGETERKIFSKKLFT